MSTVVSSVTRFPSITYKLVIPERDHAIYFTIGGKPHLFMINSLDTTDFAMFTSLVTAWSKAVQNGRPIEKIIKEMKESFDPRGPYFAEGQMMNGVLHHLGIKLEQAMTDINKWRIEDASVNSTE